MYNLFLDKVSEKVSLSGAEKDLVKTFFTYKKLKKKQYLLREGDVARNLAFVEKGLLRSYTVDNKGYEHIVQFAFEGWWITDMYSFFSGEPSTYIIDAIEDCELLLLTHAGQEEMLEKIPALERYFRILLQNNVIQTQRRLIRSHSQTAGEKYLQLQQSFDGIQQRVPQHMIASFLGITPETLSRLRKQMAAKSSK